MRRRLRLTLTEAVQMPQDKLPKRRRIAALFLFWFLLVALSSLAIVGLAAYRVCRETLENREERSLAAILGARSNGLRAMFVKESEMPRRWPAARRSSRRCGDLTRPSTEGG